MTQDIYNLWPMRLSPLNMAGHSSEVLGAVLSPNIMFLALLYRQWIN